MPRMPSTPRLSRTRSPTPVFAGCPWQCHTEARRDSRPGRPGVKPVFAASRAGRRARSAPVLKFRRGSAELGEHRVLVAERAAAAGGAAEGEAEHGLAGEQVEVAVPGARCDIPTTDCAYSFDPELERDWTWPEKYATQPEILDYLRFVADRHGLRSDIEFSTAVVAARWEEEEQRWTITTGRGTQIRCRYYIMASGCL
jgi:hypothetical protein